MPDKRDKPAATLPSSPWALGAALALVGFAAGFAAFGYWRRSALMMSAALLLGGFLRLVLPRRAAGLLVVRRRWIDVAVLFALGVLIAAVSLVVPPSR